MKQIHYAQFYVWVSPLRPAWCPCDCVSSSHWGKDLWETLLSWEASDFLTLVSAKPQHGIKDPWSIPSVPTLLTWNHHTLLSTEHSPSLGQCPIHQMHVIHSVLANYEGLRHWGETECGSECRPWGEASVESEIISSSTWALPGWLMMRRVKRKGLSLEMKGEGERLWEKASFPLCVYEGCKVEHRGALLFHSIPTTLPLISIHSTLLPLTARPLSHPVL